MQKSKGFLRFFLGGWGCFLGICLGIFLLQLVGMNIFTLIFDFKKGISLQDRWEASQGEVQALSRLKDRMGQIPSPAQSDFISEYAVSNICCGQGESHATWPIMTKLYESNLSKDEIKEFYKTYQVNVYFIDEVIEMYPDRRVNIPCYPFNLLQGHNIPKELPQDKNLYIITGSDTYTPSNPKILYCD